MQRDLVGRVKYWIENHVSFLWSRLREERRKKEKIVEKRDDTWWDSFESWNDKEDTSNRWSAASLSRLFIKHTPDQSHDHHGFPANVDMIRLNSIRCEIAGSSEELVELVRSKVTLKLFVGDMDHFASPLSHINRPDGINLVRGIVIPPRQGFYGNLDMPINLVKQIADLREKVGPGSGWVSIRVILGVTLIREWFQ